MHRFSPYLAALLMSPAAAYAAVPSVAVDIPPVYSLVDRVMGDLGSPHLLIQQGASPHRYAMRPSEAEALENADAVFWIGEDLTPWLTHSLDTLGDDALSVELMDLPETQTLEYRQGATFEAHHHDHADHDHGHSHDHDHDHDHQHQHDHAHDGLNPHAWLDPENAQAWLGIIADSLAQLDPAHASTYQENARLGEDELATLTKALQQQLANAHDADFIVFHDAYQYFENRFDVAAAGAISLGDARKPSPSRIQALHTLVEKHDIDCVFSEPQYNPELVKSVFGDTGVNTSIVIDPLGTDLTLGSELYSQLLHQLADAVSQCTQDD
ncbi:zinc ABC transporter substrate-binding protein [Chromohalobacter sarecensis]|uniref:High-affinity zinc uptake system protein ZnuA n=1 Tax=Chromohalobacter sarecensis TaxID=245294 RepID=A0ABV9D1G7_9GAMM|nr:zinc ABC transporter substrate-binding protein [Chromohalobacter sarecensis]MCK0715207.1 zinc ABC transporter substrate-binding protein [Chromohalobacter sarecensis]